MLRKDGTTFYGRIHSRPIYKGNKIIGIRGIVYDIHKRKIAEKKLKESEEKYRHLFESSPYGIWIVDPETKKIVDCNKTFNKFLSLYKREDILGREFAEVIALFEKPEYFLPLFKQRFKILLQQGKIKPIEFNITRGDGKKLWVTLESTLFSVGEKKYIQVIIKDITKRKEAELNLKESEKKLRKLNKELEQKVFERMQELRESEKNYRDMLNNLDIGFFKGKFKGELLMHNLAFNEILGFEPSENLIGNNAAKFFIYPKEQKEYYNILLRDGVVKNLNLHIKKKTGEIIIIQLNSHLIKNGEGKPIEVEGTFIDITEKFNLEKQLRESEKKLREQNIELKKLDKIKNDFITMAAHELKTPLVSIYGYTDYILSKYEKELNNEIKEDLLIVRRNIERLRNYMNQLLDVLKIDENKLKLRKTKTKIIDVINNCVKELSYQLKKKNHNLIVNCAEDIIVNVDSERIFQVISNLLSNAIKFTPENGNIKIAGKREKHCYKFVIKDNGIGLDKLELNQIFKKFEMIVQTPENSYNKEKGTGLGLYIVKGIIEAHGGNIEAFSKGKNLGTKFVFTLPL